MGRLTIEMVALATIDVEAVSHDSKVRLGDEIFVAQPNLLGSSLILAHMGVSMPEVKTALHVLFVASMGSDSGTTGTVVTIELQEPCMERLTARMRLTTG